MPDHPDPQHDEQFVIDTLGPTTPFPGLVQGIGHDAAVIDGGHTISTDTMVEGVHWDHRLSPADVGFKLVAVNVSDLAAAGAQPRWATLNLSLPAPLDRSWIAAFAEGLHAGLRQFGLSLIGGDTTRSPVRVAALTVGGHAPHPVSRAGGRPGDLLLVTGTLGRAAEAFLSETPDVRALSWFRRPQPRLEFALKIAPFVHTMMDLSDGLAADLPRLCRASGCSALVDPTQIPGEAPLSWRTSFGEDYELLFALPADRADIVESLAIMTHTPIAVIGRLTEPGAAPRLMGEAHWPAPLFTHFPGAA